MRLKKLWIDNFKNLRDFEIDFANKLTTVIIGGNGTGKSNLLEALAIIFRDLDLELKNQGAMQFEYYLEYECRGQLVEIDANPSQTRNQKALIEKPDGLRRRGRLHLKINNNPISMKDFFQHKDQYLPKHVFGYYSGPTNRLAQHFSEHQKKFYDEQRKGVDSPLRPLFFALPVHSQFVLLAYFSFPDAEDVNFLREKLGITGLESVLIVVKEPDWKIADYPDDPFWGATGIPRQFLESLYRSALAPIRDTEKVPISTGKSTDEERLYLYIKNEESLKQIAQEHGNNREFFKALDTLYIARLIAEVRIRVKRVGLVEDITFMELSEGEQQLLTVLGLLKFTRDFESLFLLDEPDTHLNPQWKLEYMNMIEPIVGNDTQCHILLCTHDPIVMGSSVKEQVRVLAFENNDRSRRTTWFEPDTDPRGMGVAALLTSEVFGLRTSLDLETQGKLDLKRKLSSKDPNELTEDEKETLRELDIELSNLGFNYQMRDPEYAEYLEAKAREREKYPELRKAVLSKEDQELQARLASELVAKLKSRPNSE